jgi:putative ABC transport system ATP-binding protein
LLLARTPKDEAAHKVNTILKAVGLENKARNKPNELSGGQRQRVAIARALVKQPQIILADEPTANLDSKTGQAIIDLMRQMQEEFHSTFIFSTHDREVMGHADFTFEIRDGELVREEAGNGGGAAQ